MVPKAPFFCLERRGREVGRRDRVRGQREGEDNRVGGAEEGRDRVGWA